MARGCVTVSVVKAEFPEFDVIRAFNCMNLAKDRKGTRTQQAVQSESDAADIRNIERLALLLDLDPLALRMQLHGHRPIARLHYLEAGGCTCMEAWKVALEKTQRHHASAKRHPVDQLRQLVACYACLGMSSSGVEQGFSKLNKNICAQSNAGNETEKRLTKLILDKDFMSAAEVDEAIALARKVWPEHFGESRHGSSKRIDRGLKKCKGDGSHDPASEIGWLRKRRLSVSQAASSRGPRDPIDLDADEGAMAFTTKAHEDEIAFNSENEVKKGHLLQDGRSSEGRDHT